MWVIVATHTRNPKIQKSELIDFIKYEIKNINPLLLEDNPYLDFYTRVNKTTAEIGKYLNAYYKGLEIKIYEPTNSNPNGRVTFEGSLHKYWNNGAHNFNDFGINEIDEVFKDIFLKFGIEPIQCVLKQLEIGVNLYPPYKSKHIITNCIQHKNNPLKCIFTKDEGNYKQAQYQRHYFKIYDKRTHYQNKGFKIEKEILRIEMKFRKMHSLNELGIYNAQDLLNYGLHNFKTLLLEQWENVILYDFNALKGTKYEKEYSNPNYWNGLNYDRFKYHRNNLSKLTTQNNGTIKKTIAELISKKVDFLNVKRPVFNPLSIGLISGVSSLPKTDNSRRFCLVTNLNISMQKNNSFLLSHTGLKYYLKTDRKVFEEVKRKYLSEMWLNADEEKQIIEIAHNIRNKYNNLRNRQKELYPIEQTNLFNIQPDQNTLSLR